MFRQVEHVGVWGRLSSAGDGTSNSGEFGNVTGHAEVAAPYARVIDMNLPLQAPELAALLPDQRYLLLFWEGDRPVGQLKIEPDQDARAAALSFVESLKVTPAAPRTRSAASVSLVICTRDRPDDLARCLARLGEQTRKPDEVIVVDNAPSDDRTREVAAWAGATYVREDRPGLDIARNTGVLAAHGEIVAYTDDDTEPHPRWLEQLVAAFDRPDVVAVTGLVLPARLDTRAQWIFENEWGFGRGFHRTDFGEHFYRRLRDFGCPVWEIGAGANMAFRRRIFDELGLFDERLDAGASGCSGDSEYWYRVLAGGYTCRYEPAAVVRHHHRLSLDGLKKQIFQYMRGHVAALFVQYERTGDRGNLRRAFEILPRNYARKVWRRMRKRPVRGGRLLRQQVAGSIAGLFYYLRTPRPRQ